MKLPALLNSKKGQAALVASLLAFAGFYLGFSPQMVLTVVSPFGVFIGAQGLADIGKGAAQVKKNGNG